MKIESTLWYLPWYPEEPDPRSVEQTHGVEEPVCPACDSVFEWKANTKEVRCPSCKRRVPASTGKYDHLYALRYRFIIRR